MCMCSGPVDGFGYIDGKPFETNMCNAPCKNPSCWCLTLLSMYCGCESCVVCMMRRRVLQGDMTKYTCYQGYAGYKKNPKAEPTQSGCVASCPNLCNCLEALCCPCASIAGSKMYLVDERQLQLDPCDNCLIKCTDACACCACVWKYTYCTFRYLTICCLLTYFCFPFLCECIENFPLLVACCIGCCTLSCSVAQLDLELKKYPTAADSPETQQMVAN